jgi:ribosomal protein L7Ae-like RNA K-turn-binding protein
MEHNALGLLGLARRGRMLELGEEACGAACRAEKARLLLVASDAGDHTVRRARSFCRTGKPIFLALPFTKAELGGALGVNACALAALTDPEMALAIVRALGEPERTKAVEDALVLQAERVKKRRLEEQAHRKNRKHGKI